MKFVKSNVKTTMFRLTYPNAIEESTDNGNTWRNVHTDCMEAVLVDLASFVSGETLDQLTAELTSRIEQANKTNTTENVLDLLRKMSQTKFDLWQMYKEEDNLNNANEYWSAYNALSVAIDLFNCEDFYKRMVGVYEEKEEG